MDKGWVDTYFAGMPQIDLGPNDYRKQDRRTGQWRIPDDPKLCRNVFFGCIAALVFILAHASELQPATLFGLGVLFAFSGGILFATWLRGVY